MSRLGHGESATLLIVLWPPGFQPVSNPCLESELQAGIPV